MVASDTIRTWRQKNNVVVVKCEGALTLNDGHSVCKKYAKINFFNKSNKYLQDYRSRCFDSQA